jgi:hypothetical protein
MATKVVNMGNNLVPVLGAADQALAVSDTVVGLAALHAHCTHVEFTVQGNPIRVRWDGTNPTSSVGHLLPVGATGTWRMEKAVAARFIRESGDGVFYVSQMSH